MSMENCNYSSWCTKLDCDKDYCPKKYKVDNLYNLALIPEAYRKPGHFTIKPTDVDVKAYMFFKSKCDDITNFVNSGQNIYIYSHTCGNGKTTWAIKFLKEYLNSVWVRSGLECKALFINVPKFLIALKENISNKNDYATYIIENMHKADLVVWDDLAAKAGTEFEINQLLSYIDDRLACSKSNIFTSNLNQAELERALGERLCSRICGMSIGVQLFGQDKRCVTNFN